MSGSQYLPPKFSLEFFASKVYLLMVTLSGFRGRRGTAGRSRSAGEASLQATVCGVENTLLSLCYFFTSDSCSARERPVFYGC